jgi:hypothetical protein
MFRFRINFCNYSNYNITHAHASQKTMQLILSESNNYFVEILLKRYSDSRRPYSDYQISLVLVDSQFFSAHAPAWTHIADLPQGNEMASHQPLQVWPGAPTATRSVASRVTIPTSDSPKGAFCNKIPSLTEPLNTLIQPMVECHFIILPNKLW